MGIADWIVDKAKQVMETHKIGFQKCLRSGVKIAFGTDACTPFNMHGTQAEEFLLMQSYGMSATEALIAATRTNAELLRMENQIGSISVGKYADIVAFDTDPISVANTALSCCFVMKGGVVYRT